MQPLIESMKVFIWASADCKQTISILVLLLFRLNLFAVIYKLML